MQRRPEHLGDIGIVRRNVATSAQLTVNRLTDCGQRIVDGFIEGGARYGGIVCGQVRDVLVAEQFGRVAHHRFFEALPRAVLVGVQGFLNVHGRHPGDNRHGFFTHAGTVFGVTGFAGLDNGGGRRRGIEGRQDEQAGNVDASPGILKKIRYFSVRSKHFYLVGRC